MKRDIVARVFSILAIILAIGAFVVAVCSCKLSSEGFVTSLIGVCATLMVGYQIWNTIDVKDNLKRNEVLSKEFESLKDEVRLSDKRAQEKLDIMQSLVAYQGQMSFMSTSDAVMYMHHAILSALDSDREDFSYMFDCIAVFSSELTEMTITGSNMSVTNKSGERIINDKRSPYYGRSIAFAIISFREQINQTSEQIRQHKRFYVIKKEYEGIMEGLEKKLKEIEDGE